MPSKSPSPRAARLHGRVMSSLGELDGLAARPAVVALAAPGVSGWSVGEHLEHLCRGDALILDALEAGPDHPRARRGGRVNLVGGLSLWLGVIPRGRGRSPEAIRPRGVEPEELRSRLVALRSRLSALGRRLAELEAGTWRSPHPVFGDLTPLQWLRFIDVHHRHHLKIVRDIRRAAEGPGRR